MRRPPRHAPFLFCRLCSFVTAPNPTKGRPPICTGYAKPAPLHTRFHIGPPGPPRRPLPPSARTTRRARKLDDSVLRESASPVLAPPRKNVTTDGACIILPSQRPRKRAKTQRRGGGLQQSNEAARARQHKRAEGAAHRHIQTVALSPVCWAPRARTLTAAPRPVAPLPWGV